MILFKRQIFKRKQIRTKVIASAPTANPNFNGSESELCALRGSQHAQHTKINSAVAINSIITPCASVNSGCTAVTQKPESSVDVVHFNRANPRTAPHISAAK